MDETRVIVAAIAIFVSLWGAFVWWQWRRQVHSDAVAMARQGEQVIGLLRDIRDELRRASPPGSEGVAPSGGEAPTREEPR